MTAEHKISDSERDLDPNVRQRHASDPERSVWVGASAGTGKTKVLTDRVLRLLLPRPDGREGTAPFRILCLTFTKAAASEMLQRINDTLSKWATIPEEELRKKLQDLSGKNPSQEDIQAARRLFAAVVDTPGGLKVMTIHSFCQSILGRFPIEAGLSPHFSVIDESQSAELIGRARDLALEKARQNEDSPLGLAVRHIAAWQNEDQFGNLLRSLCSERKQLDTLGDNPDELHKKLCALFEIAPTDTTATIISAACEETTFDKDGLYAVCRALAQGTKTDIERGHNIQLWLDAPQAERAQQIENYMTQFLTKKYEPRTKLAGKDAVSAAPEIEQILAQERDRMVALHDLRKAVQCAALTRDLFLLGQEIVSAYQRFKEERALLDYDDLILSTLDLLEKKDIAPWVMFKLDGGLDHILVDEAQDTNPEQWNVILKLTEEFFSGAGSRDDVTRTSFTVGDEKQSIYSFQRASPAEFARIRELFVGDGKADEENLNISFRTVKTVLALVDKVFRPDHVRKGLGRDAVEHISFRKGQAGLCEIWEIFKPDDKQEDELWSPPITTSEMRSGAAKLADYIGDKIKGWLDNGEQIESRGRTVQPGDIMILMRTRTAFVGQLVRALKTRNIPVSGVDRMVLGEQIAVMDLLALAQFALLPDDDLTLACVLKSPLIGLNEDQLYDLAIDRKGSLWSALRDSNHKEVTTYLHKLISDAAADHPYEFFNRILQRPCPADSVSGLRALRKRLGDDALDPLDEFLSAALSYEHDHIPTLQGFLLWQQQGDITIKRELEEAGQAVRIMTVHGAKGLQAPIVIMPDTTRTGSSRKIDNLLWPDKTGFDVPLWAPRSDDFPTLYQQARGKLEDTLDEEYRRLLYVAMTRAEDRLYIGGYQGRNKPIDDCWYNYISAAFDAMDNVANTEDDNMTIRRITDPATKDPDRIKDEHIQTQGEETAIPACLTAPAPAEQVPPRPLVPSRPDTPEPAIRSPLATIESAAPFKRGNITHTLLEILPDLPEEERRAAAELYVSRPAHKLSAALQQDIVTETLKILENPSHSALFGEGSLAEVPITGFLNGRLVSARIDRLLVTEEEVRIVDYKTNRPSPTDEKDVPRIYRDQMSSYSDIVASIYPGRTVRSFLLWTDGPNLMELHDL